MRLEFLSRNDEPSVGRSELVQDRTQPRQGSGPVQMDRTATRNSRHPLHAKTGQQAGFELQIIWESNGLKVRLEFLSRNDEPSVGRSELVQDRTQPRQGSGPVQMDRTATRNSRHPLHEMAVTSCGWRPFRSRRKLELFLKRTFEKVFHFAPLSLANF